MTSDPAGTTMTPLLAGAMEIPYKLLLHYSPDPNERLAIASTALVGEAARLFNDAIIYCVLK